MKTSWSAMMIYEDIPTREEAVKFSDSMVQRFWSRYEFDFGWWAIEELERPDKANSASEKAATADLIVFALKPEGPMPKPIFSWVENWLPRRCEREGALAGLLDPAAGPSGVTTEKYLFLRNLAHRAGMDYLIQLPEDIARPMPDSLDSYAERAGQKTSVMNDILRRRMSPPQFGQKPHRFAR